MRAEANERSWQVRAAAFPHSDKQGQQTIISALNALSAIGKTRSKGWQMVDTKQAIDVIGLDIKIHGTEWLDKHPEAKQFLAEQGISPESAVELHNQWQQEFFAARGRDSDGQKIEGAAEAQTVSLADWAQDRESE